MKKISLSYEEAQRIVQKEGISSISEYKSRHKQLGLPSDPFRTYKGRGYIDWYSFVGKKQVLFPSYEEAKRIIQKEGIKNSVVYKESFQKFGLPANPNVTYRDSGWIDYCDYFGIKHIEYPSLEEAKSIIREKEIKTLSEYNLYCKEYGLPANPARYYKNRGWIDTSDFLSKPRTVSPAVRKYRILTKLSLSPILLQEDAPLQVIYILASELDKRLAKEMEELLGVTTFEERLNWVKEQLKKLKEGCPTIPKTIDITPSDELSAMGSLLEEFDVTDKVSFTLENYLHSAVNRELISEYDG